MQQGLVLSDADRIRMDARACRELGWTVLAQAVMALIATVLAGAFADKWAAWSALGGAGAYFLPNSWLALRLWLSVRRSRPVGPAALMAQALLKLLVTVLLLWGLVQVAGAWLVWPAVLLGLVFTLKGYVLLLMYRKLS